MQVDISDRRTWADKARAMNAAANRLGGKHLIKGYRVSLSGILEEIGVRDIVFKPMTADGGLAIKGREFCIFVRSDSKEVETLREKFRGRDGRDALPSRLRFTIAHEILHTFFYQKSGDSLRNQVTQTGEVARTKLEEICNSGARRILMPKKLFALESVQELDFRNPRVLRDLSKAAGVSPDVLVKRIGDTNSWFSPRDGDGRLAGVFCVRCLDSGDYLVGASALSRDVVGMFSSERKRSDLRLMESLAVLFGQRESTVSLPLRYRDNPPTTQLCRFAREVTYRLNPEVGYFATLTLIGPPLGS